MNKIINDKKDLAQFIKFCLVGCSNTLLSLAIYYSLIYIDVHYIIANIIGFIISVLNAFYWNNKYVFDSKKESKIKKLLKTYSSYGLTCILSNIFLFIQVHYLNISKIVAPLICLLITIPLNFILNKYWTFKNK